MAPHGDAIERTTARRSKTGRAVRFEITEQTRHAIDDYPEGRNKLPPAFLFAGRRGGNVDLTTWQYSFAVRGTKIRLQGLAAPEGDEPGGDAATVLMRELVARSPASPTAPRHTTEPWPSAGWTTGGTLLPYRRGRAGAGLLPRYCR